jgi:hypothetical protein
MIKLITKGKYQLVGTRDRKITLFLDGQGYHWSFAPRIGELLTFSKKLHKQRYLLAQGDYRIYGVKDEPKLVDLQHLELSVGGGQWQGYLLLTGLPTAKKIRSRIEPTDEIIAKQKKK